MFFRLAPVWLLALFLLISTRAQAQTTVTFQDGVSPSAYLGTRDLILCRPDGDATWNPNANYGNGPLEVDGYPGRKSALLRWELTSLAPGATVTAASITLNILDPSTDVYELYELLVPWAESEVTFMRRFSAPGTWWSSAGAHSFGNDLSSTVVGTVTGNVGPVTVPLNTAGRAMVQRWIDAPASNNGVIIQDYSNVHGLMFSSSGDPTASNRPRLTVTYGGTTTDFQLNTLPDPSYGGMSEATIAKGPNGGGNLNGHGLGLAGTGTSPCNVLVGFDLSSIPSDAFVMRAELSLGVLNSSGDSFSVHEVLKEWGEATATWTGTGVAPWEEAGASGATDRATTLLGIATPSSLGTESVNLNAEGIRLVQDWVTGRKPNHGFLLTDTGGGADAALFLGRLGVPTTSRPALRVTYRMPPAPMQELQEVPGLVAARTRPVVTLLGTGQTLLTGDATAELYHPATHTTLPLAGSAGVQRGHSATALFDGRVLIAGGEGAGTDVALFNPMVGAFTQGPPLLEARAWHSATRLSYGEVLVAGGTASDGTMLATAELFVPSSSSWIPVGALSTARTGHCAVSLVDGRAAVIGGEGADGPLASVEVFDPATGTWSAAPVQLAFARTQHTCARLADGSILVLGGANAESAALRSVERLTADLQALTAEPDLPQPRRALAAVVLPSNRVLVAGGYGANGDALGSSELWREGAGWSSGPAMTSGRAWMAATLLPNGKALLVGGEPAPGLASDTLHLFDLSEPTLAYGPNLPGTDGASYGVRLPDGNTLVFSSLDSTVRRIDRTGTSLTEVGTTVRPHQRGRSVLLNDGRVFIYGHYDDVASAWRHYPEVFDPATGTSVAMPSPVGTQWVSSVLRLPTDDVLALSGVSTERFRPWTGTWTTGAPMSHERAESAGVILADGRVLVASGWRTGGDTNTAEVWTPTSDTWTGTGALAQARHAFSMAVLPDGRVWAVGGRLSAGSVLSSTEIYNPVAGTWSAGPSLPVAGRSFAMTTLPSGKVAVTPGSESLFVIFDHVRNALHEEAPLSRAGNESVNRLLPDGRLFTLTREGLSFLYDEGYGRAWSPSFEPECTDTFPGRTVRFSGVMLTDEGVTSEASELPVVMLHNLESQHLQPLPTRLVGPNAGEVDLPAVLPNGRYAMWVVSHGVTSEARSIRIGTAPGGACTVGAQCGGSDCVAGSCAGTGCTSSPAFNPAVAQRPVPIPAAVRPEAPAPPGGEPTQQPPTGLDAIHLKLACGCESGGSPLTLGLCVGALLLNRRRSSRHAAKRAWTASGG